MNQRRHRWHTYFLKTILAIFGGLCAAIAITFIGLVSIAAYTGPSFDKESKAYADAAVVAIASDWNEKNLTDRASPQLMTPAKTLVLDRALGSGRMLGALKKYDGSKGEAHVVFLWPGGKTVTADYLSRAEFERGAATIKISLIRSDGAWKIQGFKVVPDNLAGMKTAKAIM
jgi:hypothetical protein